MIIGTASYMSPEQAKGRAVDPRADIFAFGCVLCEMLTAQRAFPGEDVSEILGSILKLEPDWSRLPANLPADIRKLLRLCLEKNPGNRRSSAADLRVDIDDAQQQTDEPPVVAISATRSRAHFAWAVATLAALAFAVVATIHFREKPPVAPPEMRVDIATPATSLPGQFALSPDGRSIVFVATGDGEQRLWLRRLDQTESRPLAGTENGQYPFWSPDNKSIAFLVGGMLKRVDSAGGAPVTLATGIVFGGGSWNSDGVILVAGVGTGLRRIDASAGTSKLLNLNLTESALSSFRSPKFLPDGKHFLGYGGSGNPETQGIYLGSLDEETIKRIGASDSSPAWLPPDKVLYIVQGRLMARHFDLTRRRVHWRSRTGCG